MCAVVTGVFGASLLLSEDSGGQPTSSRTGLGFQRR
jgi:hypothetical protein